MTQSASKRGKSVVVLDAQEQAVMDHITAAMTGIVGFGLRSDTSNLEVELAAHVHGLQMFVIQHMLQRLAPGSWGRWFELP